MILNSYSENLLRNLCILVPQCDKSVLFSLIQKQVVFILIFLFILLFYSRNYLLSKYLFLRLFLVAHLKLRIHLIEI